MARCQCGAEFEKKLSPLCPDCRKERERKYDRERKRRSATHRDPKLNMILTAEKRIRASLDEGEIQPPWVALLALIFVPEYVERSFE